MTAFHDIADPQAFRAEIRAWLAASCPDEMRQPHQGEDDICWGGRRWVFKSAAQRLWLERAVAAGLTVPTWPREYGGAGLSREQEAIFRDEMARIGAASPLESFGIWMLGPALLKFASDEQKARHLPPIARGEIRWCQGYSEPGAGSDLASLRTRAVDMGDHFRVDGQKIWTSYADQADWIFCLVRTDPEAPKHRGISFLLFDMKTPGVTTRPITMISGKSAFCETFFDGVAVPKANLVGAVNEGWTVAKYLLTHERESIGGAQGLQDSEALADILREVAGPDLGQALRARFARLEIDGLAVERTIARYVEEAASGGGIGDKSAVVKYCSTELNKRRQTLIVDAAGVAGLAWDTQRRNGSPVAGAWLRAKANSIEGGTAEVMLGIISRRLLDLPGE